MFYFEHLEATSQSYWDFREKINDVIANCDSDCEFNSEQRSTLAKILTKLLSKN